MGRFDSALTVIQRAQRLDPLSPGRLNSIALMYSTLGRFDQAIEQAAKALELDPQYDDAYLAIGNALLLQGKPDQAVDEFKRAPKMGNRMLSGIASAEAARGNRDSALAVVRRLEAESRQRYVGPETIAAVYFMLGDRDKGFEWLDKAYEARSAYLALLRSDRRWDSVRDDPRFVALVKKVGI
jgi:tetratricopeptide (TPR) repeat protein